MLEAQDRGQRQATWFVLALAPVVPLLSALGVLDGLSLPEAALASVTALGVAALVRALGREKRRPMEECLTDDGVDVGKWRSVLRLQQRLASRAARACVGISALSLLGAALAGEPIFLLPALAAALASLGLRHDVEKRAERHLAQLGAR